MYCFCRGKDAEEYIKYLIKIIDLMTDTLISIAEEKSLDFSEEEILKEYCRLAEGPNTFETILIKKGKMTEESFYKYHSRIISLFKEVRSNE